MKTTTKSQNQKPQVTWFKVILCIWCFAFIVLFAKDSQAAVTENKSYRAIEGKVNESDELPVKQQKLKTAESFTQNAISREAHLQQKAKANKLLKRKSDSAFNSTIIARSMVHDFTIYNGFSELFDDFDSDGFYQTFSVTFDADVETYGDHEDAYVYAEIYLSRNGGPWEHFHTTDDFVIYGTSADDAYEVLTNLETGYPSDYYDVAIDLYEVGYSGIVASYSSDDTNNLYALTLESDNYDQVEYDEHVHVHAGSTEFIVLAILLLLLAYRDLSSLKGVKKINN